MTRRAFLNASLPAAICASLVSATRSNPEPAQEIRRIDQFHPKQGSYEGKRMSQLRIGDVFRFTDEPTEHWFVTAHPTKMNGVWGTEVIPFVQA